MAKKIYFCGTSQNDLRSFPQDAKTDAGYQLYLVQEGLEPSDWKPMKTVGPGVIEIRIADASGAFRVFYVVKKAGNVYVLHAFKKTTRKTEKRDIDLAKARMKEVK